MRTSCCYFLFIILFGKLNSLWCLMSKSKCAKYCYIICIIISFVLLTFTNYADDAEFVVILYIQLYLVYRQLV